MKGFLRSKVVLTLITLVLLAGAIAIPLSGSTSHSHAQAAAIPITPTAINGRFYNLLNSGAFDIVHPEVVTPDFTQTFPIINFNPSLAMQTTMCSNNTGVSEAHPPFTDVIPQVGVVPPATGTCTTKVAQGNGETAGNPPLDTFEAIFTANLTVPSAGQLVSTITSDDGWELSIGQSDGIQPTPAQGNSMVGALPSGPLTGFEIVGADNQPTMSGPEATTITVNFPASGTYPIELDYAECCGAPLELVMSNSFTAAPPPSPTPTPQRKQLFVLLQGISSELTQDQINKKLHPGFNQPATKDLPEGIVPFLRVNPEFQKNFPSFHFLEYSYTGFNQQYNCGDTFSHTISEDVSTLNGELAAYLKNNPHTDVYLIGHSLGGIIAFGYLAYLNSLGALNGSIPNFPDAKLKGVIALDAPLGGVPPGTDLFLNKQFFRFIKCFNQIPKTVPSFKAFDDLGKVFDTAQNAHPLGGMASIQAALFPIFGGGTLPDNQQLAEQAASQGISTLTVGNELDFGYAPAMCNAFKVTLPKDFTTTQFVRNEVTGSHVYGREISAGQQSCTRSFLNGINHGEVLTNTKVEKGLINFLVRDNPDPLLSPSQLLA